ncbi:MAG: hypothetical protein KAR42_11970 [candidate division Zixibacteria bacterium]|nr:hypothetical protein [candidate division Zixibacteria bacterium]
MSKSEEDMKKIAVFLHSRYNNVEYEEILQMISGDDDLRRVIRQLSAIYDENSSIDWEKIKSPAHEVFRNLLKDIKSAKSSRDNNVAVRVFDSSLLPLPEGVRPAGVDTRRIKYIVNDQFVELSLYPVSPGSYEVIGQITGTFANEGFSAYMEHTNKNFSVIVNDCGVFRFPRVPVGKYSLTITNETQTIARVELDL